MKKALILLCVALLAGAAVFGVAGSARGAYVAYAAQERGYIGEKLAEFTTDYSSSSEARKRNIALAARALDGASVGVGEIFSFNSSVGPRTAARGFAEAPVIENGRYVQGVGGGVCQVSSTLYNAALLAGMEITDVNRHTLPVKYLDGSRDAMVSDRSDLRFKNVTPYPLYIFARADGRKLTFTLYGFPVYGDGERVKIRSVTIKTIECAEYERLPDTGGELGADEKERYLSPPHAGLVTEAYRDYYYNGVLIRSELLRRDYYAPRKGVVIVKEED